MKRIKSILAVLLLFGTASYACVGSTHQNHFCEVNFNVESVAEDSDLLTVVDAVEANTFVSLATSAMLVTRDNTRVVKQFGLFSFFIGALKAVATWGGVKLTKWVRDKIFRRAKTYSGVYHKDPKVKKAAHHWDDLISRSSCPVRLEAEPDHMPKVKGWQGIKDCPICSKQVADLKRI